MPEPSERSAFAPLLEPSEQALLFKAVADQCANLVSIKDLAGRYCYVNPEFVKRLQRSEQSFIGHTDQELFPAEQARHFRETDLQAQQAAGAVCFEESSTISGLPHYYRSVKFPIRNAAGKLIASGVIATDITENKQGETRLWTSEELFKQVFEHATVGMCLVDVNGHLLRVNPQYCQILGYSREELEGVHINSITHPDSFKASQDFMRQALAGEVQRGEFVKRFIQKQGHVVFCRISSSLVRDHLGQPLYFISHVQDITESLRVEAELKRLANTDPLTGVANRRPFLEQMEIELARVQRFNTPASCLMLDFDHFKQINDRWGHSSGDAVLQYFSQLCQQRLRVTDLLGRLGGEEFAILMPGTDLAGATELAEQLRSWVESHPLVLREMHIPFCISLGVTELSRNDHSADEVLARTDTALYRAKDCGRNRVEAC